MNDDISDDEAAGARSFLSSMAPVIFEMSILKAENDEERKENAIAFAMSPNTDFETAQKCIEVSAIVSHQDGRADDGSVLLKYAKIVMNTFLNERTIIEKNGVSIQRVFNGEVVHSIGHAFNEGVTERMTIETINHAADEKLRISINPADWHDFQRHERCGDFLTVSIV